MPLVQMDCGPPVVERRRHELRIPLGAWMRRHGQQSMAILPGIYRMRFRSADGADQHTKTFKLK